MPFIDDINLLKKEIYNFEEIYKKMKNKICIKPYIFSKNYKIYKDRAKYFFRKKNVIENTEKQLNINNFITNRIYSSKKDVNSELYLNKQDTIINTNKRTDGFNTFKICLSKPKTKKEVNQNSMNSTQKDNRSYRNYKINLKNFGISYSHNNINNDIVASIASNSMKNFHKNHFTLIKKRNNEIKRKLINLKKLNKPSCSPESILKNNEIIQLSNIKDEYGTFDFNYINNIIKSNNSFHKKINNYHSVKNIPNKLEKKRINSIKINLFDISSPNFTNNKDFTNKNKPNKNNNFQMTKLNKKSQKLMNNISTIINHNKSFDFMLKPFIKKYTEKIERKDESEKSINVNPDNSKNEKFFTEQLSDIIKNLDESYNYRYLIKVFDNNKKQNLNFIKNVLVNHKYYKEKIFRNDAIKRNMD